MDQKPWIGVDLDGTLAEYDGWHGNGHIGQPVEEMVNRVKDWLDEGKTVKIFTARASNGEMAKRVVQQWCKKHIGQELEVTNVKDFGMTELWDDRAIQVVPNEGRPISDLPV